MNNINTNVIQKPKGLITEEDGLNKKPKAGPEYIEENECHAGIPAETASERMQKQSAFNETMNAVLANISDIIIIADKQMH